MAKSIEDVKAELTKLADGQELYEAVSNAILHERNMSKGMVRDVQTKYDLLSTKLKDVGYDPISTDVESFVKGIKEKIEKVPAVEKKLTGTEQEKSELTKLLDALRTDLSKEKESRTKFETEFKTERLHNALLPKLSGKIYSADVRIRDLIREGRVSLADDNKTPVFKSGSEIIDMEKGLAQYFEENKSDLINGQKPGPGGGPSKSTNAEKSMTRTAFDGMSPSDQMNFLRKDKGQVVD